MTGRIHRIIIFLVLPVLILAWGCATKPQPIKEEELPADEVNRKMETAQSELEITSASLSKSSFNPARGEDVKLLYNLSADANVTVKVYDPDRCLCQNLVIDEFQKAGSHEFIWDGKDIDGNIVSDQAYFFTIEAKDSLGNKAIYDPTTFSGGEEYDIADAVFDWEARTISFKLPKTSWVLAWGGISGGGPLVKIFLDWEPRPAGENIIFWDGKDQDGVANVSTHEGFVYRILTNTCPENSVIAIGNEQLGYLDYKQQPNLQREKKPERSESLRDGVKFSSHARLPRKVDRAPRFSVSFPDLTTWTEDGIPILKGSTLMQVALHEADVDYITQFRYEIAFYVDYQLYAEQEEGITPFNWVWDPAGIEPGEHILTVNVVSLLGQIGIKNLKFVMAE